ncbi:MAG: class I SAM-dependent methyltransferase [Hydrococcus sp. Prado102]|jgi:tRNA (cmo5U34)-methyltransferase|nr:class I SAM-dependent methyltransferase [Hydrococcus sp. Prado102]
MENIKKTFEEIAHEYDEIIQRFIPYYHQMLEAVVCALPFGKSVAINVIDLGSGTGTVAKLIKDAYPEARITCLDLVENMLEMAKSKLVGKSNIRYQNGNFERYQFDDVYDVAISSLALHHLLTDEDKKRFYQKIYDNLAPGGVFYNADIILASSDRIQETYMNQWKAFMRKQLSEDDIENKCIAKYYEEDRPAKLLEQLSWLTDIGFCEVDVLWKYYNFAVYGGRK